MCSLTIHARVNLNLQAGYDSRFLLESCGLLQSGIEGTENYCFYNNNNRALILHQSFVWQVPNFRFLPIWPPPLPIWRLLPYRSIGVTWGSMPFPLPVDQTHTRRGYFQLRLPEGAQHTNSTMITSKFNANTYQPRCSNNSER